MLVTDRADFSPFVSLRSFKQGGILVSKERVIISSKLAQLAQVTVGERLTLDGHSFKVAGITENYVGHFIYMDQASYQKSMESGLQKIAIWYSCEIHPTTSASS